MDGWMDDELASKVHTSAYSRRHCYFDSSFRVSLVFEQNSKLNSLV